MNQTTLNPGDDGYNAAFHAVPLQSDDGSINRL